MYRESPWAPKPLHRRVSTWIVAFLAAVVLACLVFGGMAMANTAREQGAITIRDTILNSAKQCCAVEGAYPQSIDYLEEHYGLVVNDTDYAITYTSIADNMAPSVVVVPR